MYIIILFGLSENSMFFFLLRLYEPTSLILSNDSSLKLVELLLSNLAFRGYS